MQRISTTEVTENPERGVLFDGMNRINGMGEALRARDFRVWAPDTECLHSSASSNV